MKLSRNWLQRYLKNPLPKTEELVDIMTARFAEIEKTEKRGDDEMIEFKALPDRSHDCLCHRGVARDLSVILNNPYNMVSFPRLSGEIPAPEIDVKDETLCRRYVARRIDGIQNGTSPEWVKNSLETIDARSINAIVDATNLVMFDIGQPLHAFDADKVVGKISVRRAKADETITLLDGRETVLSSEHLVIADEQGPLALAGIKGGKRAEVKLDTKNIILESANFDPVYVRRVSTTLNLRNDSSKRFENEITKELAGEAIDEVTALILENNPNAIVSPVVDIYPTKEVKKTILLPLTLPKIILGIDISKGEMKKILEALRFEVSENEDHFVVVVPFDRVDVSIPEDLVEEIVRIHGMEKIPSLPLQRVDGKNEDRMHSVATGIRSILVSNGFTETMGYSFSKKGDREIINAIGQDRPFLRTNLTDEMKEKLTTNLTHVLFDSEHVSLFDIGAVFPKDREDYRLAIGSAFRTKKLNTSKQEIEKVISEISNLFQINDLLSRGTLFTTDTQTIFEISLEDILKEIKAGQTISLSSLYSTRKYEPFSVYPRIIRDVALFVAPAVNRDEVSALIKKEAGELCVVGPTLFDVYEKKGGDGAIERVSLAYRMVFQSMERTLTDEEVNEAVNRVYKALESKGYEVRK